MVKLRVVPITKFRTYLKSTKLLNTHSVITQRYVLQINEPDHEKTCLMSYSNNKDADQPAHPSSLISAIVVRCLDSVMSLAFVMRILSPC